VHVQHVHAFTAAAIVTGVAIFAILYSQYGYFHETYTRQEKDIISNTVLTSSPTMILSNLIQEGKTRFLSAAATLKPLTGEGVTFDRNATTTIKSQ
jgi:hypothetical protein